MKIEIWSDVVCPWCFVGKRHLEQALATFEHSGDVEIEWKSYELDPDAPRQRPGSYSERIASKYGTSVAEARARMARIIGIGAAAGIEFHFDDARLGNTFDAHRLLHLAAKAGLQDQLKERFFTATFTEGRAIGDPETLVSLTVEMGIAEADARHTLESRDYAQEVRDDEVEAMEMGVRGVPFFVLDRRYAVSGAQPPAVLLEALERAWRDEHPIEMIGGGDDLCDDDTCEV
jgi:predicted DsbA family dithiol-disulfide isomerase